MRLAANEPDDGNAEGDGDGAGHAQEDSGVPALASSSFRPRPGKSDHNSPSITRKAKGNDEIAHGAGQRS